MDQLLHEKPFAAINGSGKHCNWSMSVTADNELDGVNLLKPGNTPHQNVRFLLFLAAVLKAVHKHAGLMRASIASSGNEHRLGANEAPPAIISVFMGEMLTNVIEDIAAGRTSAASAEQAMLKLGIAKLPEIARDNTDRNRTSPFAFTGAKFEFRAVGGSASIAFPVMILNTCVAEAIGEMTDALKAERKTTKNVDNAILKVVRRAFQQTGSVRFEGNNYSDAWVKEAKKRGLLNLRRTPEALAKLITKQSRDLFTRLGVLTRDELEARYNVRVERYVKDLLIELHTTRQLARTQVLPAAFGYLGDLTAGAANTKAAGIRVVPQVATASEVATRIAALQKSLEALTRAIEKGEALHDDPPAAATFLTAGGADAMAAVRDACDALEVIVDDARWPLPRYREMLFPV